MEFLYQKPWDSASWEAYVKMSALALMLSVFLMMGLMYVAMGSLILPQIILGVVFTLIFVALIYFLRRNVVGKIFAVLFLVLIVVGTITEVSSVLESELAIGFVLVDLILQFAKLYAITRLTILLFDYKRLAE
ncbi:hypothetical protein [Wolinella succinogenes]|uniref:Uncharacterized protein n=1 Tax=Wolinella succinogenes (strain ATCC 29543 / DSM 1740 / CCUG 13145 / JCM 31913 / LMG 7466 / NCTC 11488 / FDC 602W) TaxID=273121 RepID=Q7MRM0_WOLSU|nr:hypothetical protein [Wolinella succinogenes]NLU35005.1 hypothetical protein [Wolinella succinogenes]CAE10309.1 hypothetical protein WS1228 [Wolinella succinogenes]VEG80311.1 Uncharacterised protein [Wolinella succinogenes]